LVLRANKHPTSQPDQDSPVYFAERKLMVTVDKALHRYIAALHLKWLYYLSTVGRFILFFSSKITATDAQFSNYTGASQTHAQKMKTSRMPHE
jgi:hypothetical protein